MSVKLLNPTIDTILIVDAEGKPTERLVIRGIIDPSTYDAILVDSYQREVMAGAKTKALVAALESSVIPDIELGMRGDKYQSREDGGYYLLQSDVYVIDGLQRLNAARTLIARKPEAHPRIGAVIHVDSTFDWERERFRILNQDRSKVSPNVLLRNSCPDHPGIELVHTLSTTGENFILRDRVSWEQRQSRGHLLTAMRVCTAVDVLHTRFTDSSSSDDLREIGKSMDKKREVVGTNIMRDNIRTFFDLVDDCWNLRDIAYADRQPQLKGTFLEVLADFLTSHDIFWQDKRLQISRRYRAKFAKFHISDPEISRLCGSSGAAKGILKGILFEHFNKGRRNGRLPEDEAG